MPEVMRHNSSHIAETSYDPDAEDLTVTFNDGRSYVYHGVPLGTYSSLVSSSSKGRAFNALIRDAFEFEEV